MIRRIFGQHSSNPYEVTFDISGDEDPRDSRNQPEITRVPRTGLQEYEWTPPDVLRRWEQERRNGKIPPPRVEDYTPPTPAVPDPLSRIH